VRGPTRSLPVVALAAVLAATLAACGDNGPLPFIPTPEPTPVQPRQLTVLAVEPGTQAPVEGASLTVDGAATAAATDADGRAVLTALPGATLEVSAEGHDPGRGGVPATGDLTVELRPNVVSGTVTDADGKPIAGVRVFVDGSQVMASADKSGRYALGGVPVEGTLIYKMPGYRLGEIPIDAQMTKDVALEPFEARALYAPAAVFETAGRLDQMLDLIDRTEANAMVIDVKETGGWLYYETDLPEAVASGAASRPIFDLAKLLPALKERGIYTIARMVVMKDNTVGASQPELAVRNSATGQPWRDFGGGIWLDPYHPGVAEYVAAIAGDLAAKGFDEVQLDYVRFYSDGDYSVADPNLPNTQSFRLPAIRRLFRLVSDELAPTKAFFAADVFPISFIAPDDQGIGQRPEVIMPYVDTFSPMVYPSHYGPGTFGYPVPNQHPYEVIDRTLKIMNKQSAGLPMVIRPWIQDFGYGSFPAYTAAQVEAEMKALRDDGAHGWMIWNARAFFTKAALGPPRPGEEAGPITVATGASPAASASP
jgi:predicted small lipoprotein YifL